MTETTTAAGLMTLAEFIHRYDTEGPFEIIDGERTIIPPVVMGHSALVMRLLAPLHNYTQERQIGEVFVEAPFVMTYDKDWVAGSRVPDLLFVTAGRLKIYREDNPDWREKPLVLVPDLVVEVVSLHDSYVDITYKVDDYLRDGVRLVWVLNPRLETVTVYVAGSNQQTILHRDDTLTGGDVIPGWQITIGKLFE